MKSVPAVSVCIPVYNTRRFIEDAVTSVLAQTYQDFEVVIVDNASTDGTAQILERYTDPRIRVFHNPENIGAAANFNRALALARGRFLKVLCADDVLYPACLERQVPILEADTRSEIAMVGCARDIIDQRGKKWMRRSFPVRAGRVAGRTAIGMTARSGTNIIGEPHAILARTEAMRAAGGFDPVHTFCLDLDLWCRMLRDGDLFMIDEVLCGFRISNQSWTIALADRQHHEFARFLDDLERGGVSLSRFDRVSGRTRAYVNAFLRQGFTRILLLRSSES